jgi:hypothetical protein
MVVFVLNLTPDDLILIRALRIFEKAGNPTKLS